MYVTEAGKASINGCSSGKEVVIKMFYKIKSYFKKCKQNNIIYIIRNNDI